MIGSRLVMAVLGRPCLMASSTFFQWASRGPAMTDKAAMFNNTKTTIRSIRFIQNPILRLSSTPLDGETWFVLRGRVWQGDNLEYMVESRLTRDMVSIK